jgi:hypothetical protein
MSGRGEERIVFRTGTMRCAPVLGRTSLNDGVERLGRTSYERVGMSARDEGRAASFREFKSGGREDE